MKEVQIASHWDSDAVIAPDADPVEEWRIDDREQQLNKNRGLNHDRL